MRARHGFRLLGAMLVATALTVPTGLAAQAAPRATFPDRIELPTGFQPEGIAIGSKPVAYLGSRITGDIYAANLRTGQGKVISQGPGTASLGLKVDRDQRLFVAGGAAGKARVVDLRTGKVARSYTLTTNPSFINDVVLTKDKAWFTDSAQAQLYSVPRNDRGRADAPVTLPLQGEWVQGEGNNANGIARTPDGKALLVVQSNTGFLFRVNPGTGVAKRVDLGGLLLTNGDGLLLKGRTLFAVQNRLNQIAVVRLNESGTRGALADTLKNADFDVPTTVALYKGDLYLPNARFGAADPGNIAYWITKVER